MLAARLRSAPPAAAIHCRTAPATNSGPMSECMVAGMLRRMNKSVSTSMTSAEKLAPNSDRQALAGELVQDVEGAEGPAVMGPAMNEVVRPDMVHPLGAQPDTETAFSHRRSSRWRGALRDRFRRTAQRAGTRPPTRHFGRSVAERRNLAWQISPLRRPFGPAPVDVTRGGGRPPRRRGRGGAGPARMAAAWRRRVS